MDEPVALKGVIDSLEKEWALLVLDDGQRLDWPRERLPADAAAGSAFALDLHSSGELDAQAAQGTWEGTIGVQAQASTAGTTIALGDQSLRWPGMVPLAVDTPVVVRMQVDAGDTRRRRRRVQNLIDDLFG